MEPRARHGSPRKALGILGLLALIFAILLICWPTGEGQPVLPGPTEPEAVAEIPAPLRDVAATVPPDLPREGLAPRDVPPNEPPELAYVRGRCVAAESGSPLAGCTVTFSGRRSNAAAVALYGREIRWQAPEPVVTAADGRFEVAFEPMPPYQHSLDIEADGRVPRTARWGAFEPGEVDDLGDIEMASGYEVSGRVVDESGAPADVVVSLRNLPLPIRDGMGANNQRSGRADAQGNFTISVPIPAGTWALGASRRGFTHVSPSSITVREGTGADPVQVVVRRMPVARIEGVVVDEHGLPAGGVSISARDEAGRGYGARTREDGTFVLSTTADAPGPVRLEIEGRRGYEPLEDETVHEWGSTDLRLQVRRAGSFELRVVEKGSGQPVEDYSVVAHALVATSSSQTDPRLGGRHEDGRLTVDNVWRGENKLLVLPRDPGLMFSDEIRFEMPAQGIAPMLVELERMQSRDVRVVTATGEPVTGSTVELIRQGSEPFDPDQFVSRPRDGAMVIGGGTRFRTAALLSLGTTDAAGRVALPVPDDGRGLVLRTTGDHLPAVRTGVRFPADGAPVEVVVSRGGGVTGTAVLRGFEAATLYLVVKDAEGRPLRRFRREPPRLAPDGGFAVDGLVPGTYSLTLASEVTFRTERSGRPQKVELAGELAQVQVQDGRTTEITLDATQCEPGGITGRVLLDGAPLADTRVTVRGTGGTPGQYGQFVPDAEGRFRATRLLPGTYRVGIASEDPAVPRSGNELLSPEVLEVLPGQTSERDVHFVGLVMRIRLLEADGKTPLRTADVYVATDALTQPRTTDDEGWLILDPAPMEPVRLRVEWGRRFFDLGPIEVPAGEKTATFELKIGAG